MKQPRSASEVGRYRTSNGVLCRSLVRPKRDAVGPRHAYEQHGGKPTQTAGFDEVTVGGTNRIVIDAAGADLGSPTPLDGVIKRDHHRGSGGYEGLDQQEQQSARDRAQRPCCAIEEAVKGAEVGIVIAVPRYVAPP